MRCSHIVFFLLTHILPLSIFGQERTFGTLPLIQVNEEDELILEDEDLNHTDEYEHLLTIYQKLVNARGDYRYPIPPLYLKDEVRRGAYIDYKTNDIVVEKKAYDICKSIGGDDALAYLLGHELTHYYEKHAWRNRFIKDMVRKDNIANAQLPKKKQKDSHDIASIWNDVANETECDYLGGFLAYTAGYGLFEKGDDVISGLYSNYNLKDTIKGYPTRQERIALSKQSAKNLSELVQKFDMANMLLAVDMIEESAAFYQHILFQYQNRELYNNLGNLSIVQAMATMGSDLKYKYVTELDINFTGTRDTDEPKQTKIKRLIDQGISFFNSAINLDPNYAPAYLNKANAYALLKQWNKAKFYLGEEARPIALKDSITYRKTLIDLIVLEAIIEAENGNTAKAATLFNKAASQGSEIAKTNIKLMNGSASLDKIIRPEPPLSTDKIGNMSIASYFENPLIDKEYSITNEYKFFVLDKSLNDASVFVIDNLESEFRTVFLMPKVGYTGKNEKGIGIGDDVSKLSVYGNSDFTIETTQGQIIRYGRTIFFTKDNKVINWVNYGTQRT